MGIKIPDKVEPNPKANFTAFEQIADHTTKAIGAFRTIDVTQKTLKLVNQIKIDLGKKPVLPEFESKLGTAKSILAIPYLPSVTKNAIKAVSDLEKGNGLTQENFAKRAAVAVRQTAECGSVIGFSIGLICPAVQSTASFLGVVEDSTDVGIRIHDVTRSVQLSRLAEKSAAEEVPEKRATSEIKQAISDTKTHSILRLVKAVCAAVSGILGLVLLATGLMVIPAILLCTISLVAS